MISSSQSIERLQMVVEQLHRCKAHHVESVPITETFRGKTLWQGTVEVFDIVGHPKANRCYGWSYDEPEQFITILELPPVKTAQDAVKVGVAYQVKKARKEGK